MYEDGILIDLLGSCVASGADQSLKLNESTVLTEVLLF